MIPQGVEEKKRQEAELARLRRDRGEGEEVPLVRGEGVGRERGEGVELRLTAGEDSADSDDGPEDGGGCGRPLNPTLSPSSFSLPPPSL